MEYKNLGRTALRVSPICLGTMNFGPHTEEPDAHSLMDKALEAGINFFDTANVYGRPMGTGVTETIVGNWFAQGDQRREKVVIATKVYGGMQDWPNFSRLSALHIVKSCDASLKRLQTDYIDMLQFHHVDRTASWDEIWQAIDTLISQGKIVYAGSSNFAGWHIAQANETAKARHSVGLVSEQSLYNLLERTVELEVLPACEHYGLGLIPWSPLSGGLLGGVLSGTGTGRRSSDHMKKRIEDNRDQLEAYEKLCADIGAPPGQVALAWLLTRKGVTAPIIGPRTQEQLDDAIAASELVLAEETLTKLDEIFPGPKGPAPEAYAW